MGRPSATSKVNEFGFYRSGEDTPSRLINYGETITIQANVAASYITKAYNMQQLIIAENAVNVLEALVIKQAKTTDYQNELNELVKKVRNKYVGLCVRDRALYKVKYKRMFVMGKFRLLTNLMATLGLSYTPEVSVLIGKVKKTKKKKPKAVEPVEEESIFD